MSADEKTLSLFTTRVRQMILQYEKIKEENQKLIAKGDERDAEIKQLEAKLDRMHTDFESLKMAKMIEIADGDIEGAQKKLSRLVREVNKCITLLSGEEQE